MWVGPAIVAAVASLALVASTFTPWWSAAVVIDLVVLYAASAALLGQASGD